MQFELNYDIKKFEIHGVKMTESFYQKYIKEYRGCVKGADGVPGNTSIRDWLLNYKDNLLRGTDDTFVAIPSCLYEYLIQSDTSEYIPYSFVEGDIEGREYKQIIKLGGENVMGVYLGNLTIEQLESRLQITLKEEQRNKLKSMIEPTIKKVKGNTKIHIYDIPLLIECGDAEARAQVISILEPYAKKMKAILQIGGGV